MDNYIENLDKCLKKKNKVKGNILLAKKSKKNSNYICGDQEIIRPFYIDVNKLNEYNNEKKKLLKQIYRFKQDKLFNYSVSTDIDIKKIEDRLNIIDTNIDIFKHFLDKKVDTIQNLKNKEDKIDDNLRDIYFKKDISDSEKKDYLLKLNEINNLNKEIENLKLDVKKITYIEEDTNNILTDPNQKITETNEKIKLPKKNLYNKDKDLLNVKISKKNLKSVNKIDNNSLKLMLTEVNKKTLKKQSGGQNIKGILKKNSVKNYRNIDWDNQLEDGTKINDSSTNHLDILKGLTDIDLNNINLENINNDNFNNNDTENDSDSITSINISDIPILQDEVKENNNQDCNIENLNLNNDHLEEGIYVGGSQIVDTDSSINETNIYLKENPVLRNPSGPVRDFTKISEDSLMVYNSPQNNQDFKVLYKYNDIDNPEDIVNINNKQPFDPSYLRELDYGKDNCIFNKNKSQELEKLKGNLLSHNETEHTLDNHMRDSQDKSMDQLVGGNPINTNKNTNSKISLNIIPDKCNTNNCWNSTNSSNIINLENIKSVDLNKNLEDKDNIKIITLK